MRKRRATVMLYLYLGQGWKARKDKKEISIRIYKHIIIARRQGERSRSEVTKISGDYYGLCWQGSVSKRP